MSNLRLQRAGEKKFQEMAGNEQSAVMSSDWTTVCTEDDLIIGSGVCALVDGQQIALFRETGDSSVYAISNFDPFSEANVLSRGIIGSIGGNLVVASPIFKQHFCLQSGQCLEDGTVSVKTYPVRVEDGEVQVKA